MLPVLLPLSAATTMAQETPAGTRICLAPSQVEEGSSDAASAQGAVREGFAAYLTGPSLTTDPLKARLDSQVREEAKAAGCSWLLFTSVKLVHRKGGGGFLGGVAAAAAAQGAYEAGVASGSTVGRIAGSATYQAAHQAAWNLAATVKNKDELSLGYRLEKADGTVVLEKKEKRKASSDGEDLLTPMVQGASEAIASATKGARP